MAPNDEGAIAIVGMSARVPGANSPDEFWASTLAGETTTSQILEPSTGALAFAGGTLDEIEGFDSDFFGMTRAEAALLDPQHRLLLTETWDCVDRTGLSANHGLRVGVFAGTGFSTYLLNNVWPFLNPKGERRPILDSADDMRMLIANDKDFLAGRLAYLFGFEGPSVSVQAACATGLYAVHLAVASLRSGECDAAVVGAVNATVPQLGRPAPIYGNYVSADGRTRSFGAEASGSVFSSGVGVVVLKRLEEAESEGDHIHAVVLGSAIGNDGARKGGLTAPSAAAQQATVADALADAGVVPSDIGMVEAHGTATPIGDPIEIAGLNLALRGAPVGSIAVTTAKAGIGHAGWAAGILGFIRAVLAVEHGVIPPVAMLERANPELDLAGSPLRLIREAEEWAGAGRRIAGVSSFGVTGFNAHVVIGAVARHKVARDDGLQLVKLSAPTETLLDDLVFETASWADRSDSSIVSVARATDTRRAHAVRRAVIVTGGDLANALRRSAGAVRARSSTSVGMIFSGYHPIESLGEAVSCWPDIDLTKGAPMIAAASSLPMTVDALGDQLPERQVAQYAYQVMVACWWREQGVQPGFMVGHSLGEYAAAHIAGVFSFDDGAELVRLRAGLLRDLPPSSAMAFVAADTDTVLAGLAPGTALEIGAENSPYSTVLTGPRDQLASAISTFEQFGVKARLLPYGRAGHSSALRMASRRLSDAARRIGLKEPTVSIISTLTGGSDGQRMADPDYWASQLCEPVRFSSALLDLANRTSALVEVGPPGAPTATLALQNVPDFEGPIVAAATNPEATIRGLGELWEHGVAGSLKGTAAALPSPTARLRSTRHWIEASSPTPSHSTGLFEETWAKCEPTPAESDLRDYEFVVLEDADDGPAEELLTVLADMAGGVHRLVVGHDMGELNSLIERPVSAIIDARPVAWVSDPAIPAPDIDDRLTSLAEVIGFCRRNLPDLPLVVLTRGGTAANGRIPEVTQAAAVAFVRAAALEDDSVELRQVDLEPGVEVGIEVGMALSATSVAISALGAGAVFERVLARREWTPLTQRLDARASYIVTGASGALAPIIIRDLLNRGARKIVATSRRAIDEAVFEQVQSVGASLIFIPGDITLEATARKLVAIATEEGQRLAGIVHCAGVIDDVMVSGVTVASVRMVFAAKVGGAIRLAQAVAKLPYMLDFTCYFSSIAGVLGNPGQSNYAAANACLDALAQRSRAQGHRVVSVAWGAWGDAGLIARNSKLRDALHRRGMNSIDVHASLDILGYLLAADTAPVVGVVVDHDWPRYIASLPPTRRREFTEGDGSAHNDPEKQPTPSGATPVDNGLATDLGSVVRSVVHRVIGVIEDDTRFDHAGLDSFGVVQLRNGIHRATGVTIPAEDIAGIATTGQLVARVYALQEAPA